MIMNCLNNRKLVLSYPVDLCNQNDALNMIKESWHTSSCLHIVTLNAEMIIAAQNDKILDKIIRQAGLVIPDGAGIILALKLHGIKAHRLPGIELAYSTLKLAAQNNIPVALLGGSQEVSNQLQNSLSQKIPGLNLVYCENGYFDPNKENRIIDNIQVAQAKLVLVAMGVPRQEYFIEKAMQKNANIVFIGVGGSFDVWVEKKERAPKEWQDLHLEWLYRLVCEPWRFRRMMSTLPNFTWQTILEFLKGN